ncbi:MAG: hypothetical protein BWY69_00234 [Planctomycetes bacterium ADurb.Bin401]|nr:MAG: hypothetical protein BWY69_00234 [Planctomycetes bacterium ADurb.Bin401]
MEQVGKINGPRMIRSLRLPRLSGDSLAMTNATVNDVNNSN